MRLSINLDCGYLLPIEIRPFNAKTNNLFTAIAKNRR